MAWRKITIILMVAAAVVLITWDIFVAVTPEKHDTISAVLLDWSQERLGFAWALGAMGGHFTWPSKKEWPTWAMWAGPFTLLGLFLLFVLVPGILNYLIPNTAVAFIVGFPFGRLLWPQIRPESDPEKPARKGQPHSEPIAREGQE